MRLTANVRTLSRMLDHYSHFNPSPLSVKQFIDFGKKKLQLFVDTLYYYLICTLLYVPPLVCTVYRYVLLI